MATIGHIFLSSRKKMIAEIVSMGSLAVVSERTFSVVARVDCIYEPSGWCYIACYRCSKKIQAIGGLFVCNICDTVCRYPMIRYRMQLCTSDSTGNIIFTIFNRLGEKILDSSAHKFYNRLPPNHFPEALLDLVGRFFSFEVRLPDCNNADPDFHTYRVVSMTEVKSPPEFESCSGLKDQVGVPNTPLLPACSGPSKVVESGASTSRGVDNLDIPTPQKDCNSRKRRTG